jgi:ubiquinone/menaquinone biosynthesis C-methylase UbiE
MRMGATFHGVLEVPWVYRLAQFVLAPGFHRPFVDKIREVSCSVRPGHTLLDVGCGPDSWIREIGLRPIGLDILPAYSRAFARTGSHAVTASALALPFREASFDGVWCFSVLHHLTDAEARQALREMVRVCRRDGYVIVWDAVLPACALRRPIAWLIRRFDRGGKVRGRSEMQALLAEVGSWKLHDFRYTIYGLEGIFCVLTLGANSASGA